MAAGDIDLVVTGPDGRLWNITVLCRPGSSVRDWEVRDGSGHKVADGWSYRGPEAARKAAEKAYRKASGAASVHGTALVRRGG